MTVVWIDDGVYWFCFQYRSCVVQYGFPVSGNQISDVTSNSETSQVSSYFIECCLTYAYSEANENPFSVVLPLRSRKDDIKHATKRMLRQSLHEM